MTKAFPPQPLPDVDSEGFWLAAKEGRLALQYCAACQKHQFPPLEGCRSCGETLSWKTVSGRGVIHTFIIEHHMVAPGFDDKLPYAIALVCPEEAPHVRIPSRIVCDDLSDVVVGARVTATLEDLPGGDFKYPVFRLES